MAQQSECVYRVLHTPLISLINEYSFSFLGYFDAHIIPVDIARSKLFEKVPSTADAVDELTYKTPLIGGIKPYCPRHNIDKKCTGTLNGCLKDGRGNGVTIVTDSGEYDLYLADYKEEGKCVYVKLKSNVTIPATNVRYIYARFTFTSDGCEELDLTIGGCRKIAKCEIYRIPYAFSINRSTDTLTIIHCRI